MRPSFDDPKFRQAVLNVINAANDAAGDARRYGFDKGTQNRCQEIFRLARTVSKVIPAARKLRATSPGLKRRQHNSTAPRSNFLKENANAHRK